MLYNMFEMVMLLVLSSNGKIKNLVFICYAGSYLSTVKIAGSLSLINLLIVSESSASLIEGF